MALGIRRCCSIYYVMFLFLKQKTAYEMRISDWMSDVCSSDLTKPAKLALLMENTLCGRNPVTYIAVRPFAGCGRSLNVYYGSKQPSGVNSSGLCGTFNYEAR